MEMENLNTKPSIIIVSSSNTKPKSLIKLIAGGNTEDKVDHVVLDWQIDTKYYTADVKIYGINENYIRTDKFNDSVEALVIHIDCNKESGLVDAEKWLQIETDCYPEIKLLVTNYCNLNTKVTKPQATEWCLKRGFELIELYPATKSPDEDEEEEEIIKERYGVERIIEALQTHVWPNLIMKDEAQENHLDMNNSILDEFLTDEGTDDFTELFSQLSVIKESIKSMPASQRKQCAEHMVTAFWRAMGGDEEEIGDV